MIEGYIVICFVFFGQFLQQEFDYSTYLLRNMTGAKSVPFRDIGNESYWHVDMYVDCIIHSFISSDYRIDKAGLQYYIESELRPELQKLIDDSKLHWLPIEQIISELEQCQHFQYNSVTDQHFTVSVSIHIIWCHLLLFFSSIETYSVL